jgi:hypothetical protein
VPRKAHVQWQALDQALGKRARRLALESRNRLDAKAGMNPPDGLQKEKT